MNMSIENRARLIFAGVVLAIITGGLIWYVQTTGQFRTYQIVTPDPVSGLIADAPVEFHGVEVGKVKQVQLAGPHAIRILLDVKKDAPITAATVATITARGVATRGFTGYVYIALEDSGSDFSPIPVAPGNNYPQIATAPSRTDSLDVAISQVNRNVQAMTDMLHALADDKTISSLKQSVDNLQQVTHMLADNSRKLNTLIANTEQASGEFKPLLDASNDTVRALQSQVLPQAYQSLARLDRLTSNMTSLTEKIDRNPSILVRGSVTPPGPGETE